MYIRKTGYVTRVNNGGCTSYESYSFYDYDVSVDDYADKRHSGRVEKMGRILTLREERASQITKSADLETLKRQGVPYYQVLSKEGACEVCRSHDGAIYPVSDAVERENLPPFHPHCKCSIIGFGTSNPNDDPMQTEFIFWVDIIMYGGSSLEEQAKALIGFYSWENYSLQEIMFVLSGTEHIKNPDKRIYTVFAMLEEGFEIRTVEDWLNLYNNPTVAAEGRIVEMPDLEGWNPFNWYAFERKTDINHNARDYMERNGISYEVNIGSKGEVTDADGRYWIAVGPNVMNPDHLPSEEIILDEMKYGSKVDVVLRHDDGTVYFMPCVIGDTKAHTWPDGIYQTGYGFPDGVNYHPIDKIGWPIEFVGEVLPEGLINFEIVNIIVYD